MRRSRCARPVRRHGRDHQAVQDIQDVLGDAARPRLPRASGASGRRHPIACSAHPGGRVSSRHRISIPRRHTATLRVGFRWHLAGCRTCRSLIQQVLPSPGGHRNDEGRFHRALRRDPAQRRHHNPGAQAGGSDRAGVHAVPLCLDGVRYWTYMFVLRKQCRN